jgi:hypothetical protein
MHCSLIKFTLVLKCPFLFTLQVFGFVFDILGIFPCSWSKHGAFVRCTAAANVACIYIDLVLQREMFLLITFYNSEFLV